MSRQTNIIKYESSDVANIYILEMLKKLDSRQHSLELISEILREAIKLINFLKNDYKLPKYFDTQNRNSIKFREKDFNDYYESNAWGGLVYEFVFNLHGADGISYFYSSDFSGDTYYGTTGRKMEDRLLEHLLEAISDYQKNIINYNNGKKYNRLNYAIIAALLYFGYSLDDIKILKSEIQKKKITDKISIVQQIADELITRYKVLKVRIIELTEIVDYAFKLEQDYVIKGGTNITGLNTVIPSGVAPANVHSLPYYDIALMIALGFNQEKIHKLTQKVIHKKISYRTFRTHFQRVFGSYYLAQERLLKPVISSVLNTDYGYMKGFQVYSILKSIANQKERGGLLTWFMDWSSGGILLDYDLENILRNTNTKVFDKDAIGKEIRHYYQRFYGIPWKVWVSLAIQGLNTTQIAEKFCIPVSKVIITFNKFGGYFSVQKEGRRKVVIDLLKKGEDPKWIIYETFGYTKKSNKWIKSYYESIFDNKLTYEKIINNNWKSHHLGWLNFFNI